MITQEEYKLRRDKLAKKLKNNSMAYISSAELKTRSHDTQFPFRQESNFYYLSGFKEDSSHLLFIKKNHKVKVILFVEKKDPNLELWNGKRLGVKEAKKLFLVDKVFENSSISSKLKKYSEGLKHIYYDFASKPILLETYLKSRTFISHGELSTLIANMRLVKSTQEIKLIKEALIITKEAHHNAMKNAKKAHYEYELLAEFEYIFKKNGAYSDAYTSIIAGANNANTLHYIKNDELLKDGDLILIDAGCEYEYYASDITRTIPYNGKFTLAQQELYEMVLDVEEKIISMVKPNIKRSYLQKQAVKFLVEGMLKCGILKGDFKTIIKKELYKKYYPHGIGHWMGLDVHDNAPYADGKNKEIPLAVGMVLTIEPGIYIDKDDENVPKKYRGIGIRIEDDILVTKDGFQNLSKDIIKSVKEIEIMAKGKK